MAQAACRRRHHLALLIPGLAILIALALASPAAADGRVRLQAKIEPTYPVTGEEFRLRVQVTDTAGRPLTRAQVVATVWMDPGQHPNMAMAEADRASNALRLVGRPQETGGEYLFTVKLPMTGRWRARVFVNSSGNTGSIPLDFDVLPEPPPTETNWPLVILSSCMVAFGSLLVWWRAARPPRAGGRPNLLAMAPLRSLLRSRWYPALLQWPTLAVFAAVVYVLLVGASEAHDNFGSALTWVVWWPLLPLVFLLVGRLWCAVCPMSLLSDLIQRLLGRRRAVPAALKRRGPWLVLGAFLAITWADPVLGLAEVPRRTAYLLLAVAAGVVICGLIFERRAWCRYLCPIGGLSGNYAMAAALELRADGNVCRDCHSFACVRGDARTPGCPMFEFPRTMASNHHCNLCGNCLKSCPSDALRLTLRPPGEELGCARRGHSHEVILAAMLLGAVAMQSVVMLESKSPLLAASLGQGHDGGNLFALTAIFVVLTGLPLVALFLAGFLSAAGSRGTAATGSLRFGYALIPLGLAAHLAHNLNHLLGEGRSVAYSVSRLLGQPIYASPALESPSTIRLLQYALVVGGAVTSLAITWRLARPAASPPPGILPGPAKGKSSTRPTRLPATLPYQTLIALLAAGLLVLFGQNMAPRLQLSAEAHDGVSPERITAAQASVAAFLGRTVPLEYVHLEEHGYQDIILRSGDTYYFVDAQNMLVVSMFSSRFRAVAPTPIGEATARQIALDFALQHYPSFSRHDLQPAWGPEDASPYPGGHVFEWRQYLAGVIGPNYVKVTTDDFGAVAIYSARDVEVVAPSEPLVSKEQAIVIASGELEVAAREVRAVLDIAPELTGRQVLRWSVILEGISGDTTPWAEVVVDARSGEVLSIVRWS